MSNWGNCQYCKWWQIEPDGVLLESGYGLCTEKSLERYLLRVSGGSGCGLFVRREQDPARAPGSSANPPDSRSMPDAEIPMGGEP
jgi:hypothetical protein